VPYFCCFKGHFNIRCILVEANIFPKTVLYCTLLLVSETPCNELSLSIYSTLRTRYLAKKCWAIRLLMSWAFHKKPEGNVWRHFSTVNIIALVFYAVVRRRKISLQENLLWNGRQRFRQDSLSQVWPSMVWGFRSFPYRLNLFFWYLNRVDLSNVTNFLERFVLPHSSW
jgi:hypothetical protein